MAKWWASGSTCRGAVILYCCLFLGWQAAEQQMRDIKSYSLEVITSDDRSFPISVAISSLFKLKLFPNHHIDLSAIGMESNPKTLELMLDDRAQLADENAADPYEPAMIEAPDYPGLMAPGQVVSTIALPTILATYNWQPGGERYAVVARLVVVLFDKLLELQDTDRHSKWRAIDLTNELAGWKRWHPAEAWVKQIVDSEHPPQEADDDVHASDGFPAIGSRPANHEIGRHQEASLVD